MTVSKGDVISQGRTSRRNLLSKSLKLALVTPVALAGLPQLAQAEAPQAVAQLPGGATANQYALELDGQFAGWLQSVEGGEPYGAVVLEKAGSDRIVRKHLAGIKYEDITISCGANMSKAFFDWIKAILNRTYPSKSGAIVTADARGRETARLEFSNVLISEISFPKLDASDKGTAYLTVKFSPEFTRHKPGTGKTVDSTGLKVQKKWLARNFRLQLAGLDDTTSHVSQIEALTIKQPIQENVDVRDVRIGLPLEIPNLVITFPESYAKAITDWRDDFLIKGNRTANNEKTGTLEFLAPDQKEVLLKLTFFNLGIFKLTPDKVEAGSESVRRISAQMYCEDMHFDYGTVLF